MQAVQVTTGTFYRAVSPKEFCAYIEAGTIPSDKNWGGLNDYLTGFGFRVINRLKEWVKEGEGPWGRYGILISVNAELRDFKMHPMESEVYLNTVPISIDHVVIHSINHEVRGD